ncbi:uncharacterized protein V6R79_002488 [Siganus canaliculatus]
MDGKRTCGKCQREVAEANFALHETHCSRFLCLCPDCGETVPTEQLEQHREEEHTEIRCSKCHKKMERCHLEDHEAEECVERLQSCQFCELELPWKELDEHQLVCGSRTELCRECGRYVTLRDQPNHALTCSATDRGSDPPLASSTLPPSKTKVSSPAEEDTQEHELKFAQAKSSEEEEKVYDLRRGGAAWLNGTLNASLLSNQRSNGPWGGAVDPDRISTCPHCHLALPLFTLHRHQVKCQIHRMLK